MSSSRRWRAVLVATACAAVIVPLLARAHGRFPATVSLALRLGGDGDDLLLGTTFGALVSRDRGATWDWICEESIGYRSGFDPSFVWTSTSTMFTPSFDGLMVSRDGGCTWSGHPDFGTMTVSDLVPMPADPTTLLATAMTSTISSALFRSTDGGRTFAATNLRRTRVVISSVRIARSDPRRLYAAGWYFAPRGQWIFRSDDGGGTWRETVHSFPDEGLFALLAVHPTNPDVLYARVAGVDADYVMKSEDGGGSFNEVLRLVEGLRSLVLSEDGQTVWVAATDKLYRSTNGAASFTLLPKPTRNACVTRDGSTLYACGWPFTDDFALGRSADDGDTFEKVYTLKDVRGPLECPEGSTVHTECTRVWPLMAEALGVAGAMDPPDAGSSPDAAASASDAAAGEGGGDVVTGGGGEGCGCSTGASSTRSSSGVLGLAIGLVAIASRRLRERRRERLRGRLRGRLRERVAVLAALVAVALSGCSSSDPEPPVCGEPAYKDNASDEVWIAFTDAEKNVASGDPSASTILVPSEGQVLSSTAAPIFRWSSPLQASLVPARRRARPSWLTSMLLPEAEAHLPPVTGTVHSLELTIPGRDCPLRVLTTRREWEVSSTEWEMMTAAAGQTLSLQITSAYLRDNRITEGPYRPGSARAFKVRPR